MTQIHPTAIVDKKARLGKDVAIGPFSIVEGDVEIGEGTQIDSNVLVAAGARIGKNCRVHHGAAISTMPQDLKFTGERTTFEMGDNTVVREFCSLNRGTSDRGKTKIGRDCFIMAFAHTAHDCLLGDHVILANGVQLAGHVTIEEWVTIGGMTPVHQFCTVGKHAFVGGAFRVVQDVPPYILAGSEPLTFKGLNTIGLKRRGFEKNVIMALRRCYRLIYQSKMNLSQAVKKIQEDGDVISEVQDVIDFIDKSERGIVR